MKESLKILHIEDNPLDAELIHDHIRDELNEVEIKLVSRKNDLIEALETEKFNLILCDFKLPALKNGFEALEIIKERLPEMPVLFISGTIGEELAVDLLKKGATDYILKDNLLKLIPSIKRAIAENREKTDRITAQKALKESEERFRNLFLNSPVGIYRSTPDGEITLANPFLLKVLGYSTFEELKKKNLERGDFLGKKERKRFKEIMEKNDEGTGFETVWLRKDGTPVYILENSRAIRGSDNEFLYYEGTIEDITEKKLAQDSLKLRETQLSAAQEIANIGNWDLDLLWDELTWSKGMYKILGLNHDNTKLSRDLLFETIHPDDKEEIRNRIEKEIPESLEGTSFYYRIIKPEGEVRKLYCIVKTELTNNKVRKIFGTVQDVTEQKKAENELIEAKKRAEESDKLKTNFLSLMSHEIRTPLNTLFNLSHLVSNEIAKENIGLTELFESIDATGKRLLRTIELILNMATINSSTYSVVKKELNLKTLINNIIKGYENEIKAKKLNVNINFDRDDEKYKTDDYLLKYILLNLIDNSIKYTKDGQVNIHIYGNENLGIDVSDTGIGIADEYLPNLFKPFTQESSGYSRKYEGNGLGLAVTKNFVELLDGKISVKSKKGEGTTFLVML